MKVKNDEHYDHVTDAWQDIMGQNFHLGYFSSPDVSLPQATDALIEKMASLATITEETKILDVGCGIGTPAMYLAHKYKCSICGITTSAKGVETAQKRWQTNGHRVEFKVADGTNNGEPANSYDIAWVMESSHLMEKPPLLSECYRVLKPKGALLLCDLMFVYDEPFPNLVKLWKSIRKYSHRFVYGDVKTWPIERYWKILHKIGFNEITTIDVSEEAFPTMAHWRQNIINNETEILRANKYTKEEIDAYLQSCERLEAIFNDRLVGYAIIKATKY